MSSLSGITWTPGQVVVFDGMESVRELAMTWYRERLSEAKVGAISRDDAIERRAQAHPPLIVNEQPTESSSPSPVPHLEVEITEGEPIHDRGSSFVGRVCHINHPSQVRVPR